MIKTDKIKSVSENRKNYAGRNGQTYVHEVTLTNPVAEMDNVVTFEYHSLKPTCESFQPGQEYQFELDKKVNGNYTNYHIKPVKSAPAARTAGAAPKSTGMSPSREKEITAMSAASSAATFYSNRGASVSDEMLLATAEKIYNWITSKK